MLRLFALPVDERPERRDDGSMRRYVFRNGRVMKRRRKASTFSSAMAPNTSHNVASHGVADALVTEYATRAMPAASVAARRDTRW